MSFHTMDYYLNLYLCTFLNPEDIFVLYETCKSQYNLIRSQNILKRSPCSLSLINNIELLYWARQHPGFKYNKNLTWHASEKNYFELIKELYDDGCELDRRCFVGAAMNNNLRTTKWLRKNGLKLYDNVFNTAAEHADLKYLKWLYKHDCPYNYLVVNKAISSGDIRKVKYLVKKCEYPWDSYSFILAADVGSLDILRFLFYESVNDLSKPFWSSDVFYSAGTRGDYHMMKWLKDNSCPWDFRMYIAAINNNDTCMLKWLKDNRCPWHPIVLLDITKDNKEYMLKWLYDNDFPILIN